MRNVRHDIVENRGPLPGEGSMATAVGGDAGLFDAWAAIRRRKGLIIFGLLLGLGLATLYYFQATPKYESTVQILVMKKDANLPARGVEADQYGREAGYEDLLATHVELFQSPRIIAEAIKTHGLESLPTFVRAKEKKERGHEWLPPSLAAYEETRRHFDPVEFVQDNLTVEKGGHGQGKEARVLRASFRAPVAKDCALVMGAIVESYRNFLGETFQETSSEAVTLITQAKEELRNDLAESEAEYRKFRAESPPFWEGNQGINPYQEKLRELEKALVEVRLRRATVSTRLQVIEDALAGGDADELADTERLALISGDDVERLRLMVDAAKGDIASEEFLSQQPLRTEMAATEIDKLLSLLLRQGEILADYGPDHPDAKKIRNQIETAQKYIQSKVLPEVVKKKPMELQPADLLTIQIGLLRHDLDELSKREQQLNAFLDEAHNSAKTLVQCEVDDEILHDKVLRNREFFHTIVDRLSEISLIKDFGGYITEVIAPVETPMKAVSPLLWLVLMLGGVIGLGCGGALAYLVDISDRTFRSPDEVRRALQLPLMGDVPTIRPARRKSHASRNGKNGKGGALIGSTVVTYHRPRSREAEAFRGLRTALCFRAGRDGHRVILLTSPNPKDGKTTVTANLAISLAQSGKTRARRGR